MSHTHAPTHRGKLAIVFGLTAGMCLAQLVGWAITGSLALLTDTAHAVTDASGLFVALIAAHLMTKPADDKRTWGFRRIEVVAALGQATLLIVVGCYALIEGIHRLVAPPEVPGAELLVFGVIGLCVNITGIVVLSASRADNFNMRAAFLEVANDALGSFGVIVAAIVIETTGFQRADAIAGLFIACLIVPRAVTIMRETLAVVMEFTPKGLDLEDVRRHICSQEHVLGVHDLHVSTVATGLPIISAHVVVQDDCFSDAHAVEILTNLNACVAHHFDVPLRHSTFQLETTGIACREDAVCGS